MECGNVSNTTPNLNLIKPETSDYFDIEVVNQNMDNIDSAIAECEDKIETLSATVGNVESQLAEIKSMITSLSSTLSTVNSNLNTVKSNVSTVKTDVSTNKANINSLTTKVTNLGTSVTEVKTAATAANTNASNAAKTYNLLKNWIASSWTPTNQGSEHYGMLCTTYPSDPSISGTRMLGSAWIKNGGY